MYNETEAWMKRFYDVAIDKETVEMVKDLESYDRADAIRDSVVDAWVQMQLDLSEPNPDREDR